MLNNLDKSEAVSRAIRWLSTTLSARRGLPMIAAIGLTIFSLLVHIVFALTGNALIGICGFGLLHIAIIVGFVGALLAEPLGRG